jgi:hypothetical protein
MTWAIAKWEIATVGCNPALDYCSSRRRVNDPTDYWREWLFRQRFGGAKSGEHNAQHEGE